MRQLPVALEPLRAYKQFVNYKLVPVPDKPGKMTKIPYNANTNIKISSVDPTQWMTCDEAFSADDKVGFVFTENDPYWFLDIDNCLQPDGQWSSIALDILAMLPGAAVEVSSSGTGLHLFGYGNVKEHGCKNTQLNLELYHTERFVAFGHLESMTGNINLDFTAHINAVVDKYFQPKISTGAALTGNWTTTGQDGWLGPDDDNELIKIAIASASAAAKFGGAIAFESLMSGDEDAINQYFNGDRSSADASLAQHLAFWTGKNCERMKRIMFTSGLVREKWQREDYINNTIINACNMQTTVFVSKSMQQREIAMQVEQSKGRDNEGVFVGRQLDWRHIGFIDVKANGKPKGTYGNFVQMIEYAGISCKYNLMSKSVELTIPRTSFVSDNAKNSAFAVLRSFATSLEYPIENLDMYCLLNANENPYHPAINWIDSKPWDGVDRFEPLVKTLDPVDHALTTMLLRKWCIGAVNHIYQAEGAKSSGILVLQGHQNLGKTRWLMNLTRTQPHLAKEGVTLNPADRDSVKQTVSYWIVELGELDATFRKSDVAALKSFITRDHDEFRMPYAHAESKYPRKTVFCASVNPVDYLHDPTGSRRYWTIEVGPKMLADHTIDMQQFWAQIKILWETNADVTWLREHEHAMLEHHNEVFKKVEVESEILFNRYDVNSPFVREMTISEILAELGIDPRNARAWSGAVQKFTKTKGKRSARGNIYLMPVLKNPFMAGRA